MEQFLLLAMICISWDFIDGVTIVFEVYDSALDTGATLTSLPMDPSTLSRMPIEAQ